MNCFLCLPKRAGSWNHTIRTADWLRWKKRAKTAGRAGRVNSEYLMHISSHAKTIDEAGCEETLAMRMPLGRSGDRVVRDQAAIPERRSRKVHRKANAGSAISRRPQSLLPPCRQ